jgi:DNA-binding transcriptional ArsR family regulator
MRTSAPPLLPIFRSDLQGRLLALLYVNPRARFAISELAHRLDVHVSTVQREVDRLERAGLVTTRRIGRTRLAGVELGSPYAQELGALVLKVYGPTHVLARELAGIAGIERAWIYGSWAARARGEPGPAPADIDVLVVGTPDPDAVDAAIARAEREIGIEVNVTILAPETWRSSREGFIQTLRSGPLIEVPLPRE